jgi:pimeloyl-ACP methyl ester carboxylesterase
VSRLAGGTLRAATSGLSELQRTAAGRVFRAIGPAAAPVRRGHDLVAGAAYGIVGGALGGGAWLTGVAAATTASGLDCGQSPAARKALAVLNGCYGDLLERAAPSLAARMAIRQHTREISTEPAALAAAFPDATGRIVVFLHGLTDNEDAWAYRAERHHGRKGVTYGSLLHRDLGMTPVYLRYNTGLHISDNGRHLDRLIARLAANWPVPVREITLIGHSMGGLVARSALHQAGGTPAGQAWTRLVGATITLGTPHLGAPLERGAHRLTHLLQRLPETRALGRLLAARSAGIKDLRHGTLVAADWQDRDLDAAGRWPHTHVPLHEGARHYVVLATLARNPERASAGLIGDLMVSPRSAYGDTGDEQRLAFPADHVRRLGRLHHLDLLNHPRVYQQLRDWLTDGAAD